MPRPATEEPAIHRKARRRSAFRVVYVDFREKPIDNTEPSMRLIGKLFGKEERAEEFIAFRAEEIARVTDVIAKNESQAP